MYQIKCGEIELLEETISNVSKYIKSQDKLRFKGLLDTLTIKYHIDLGIIGIGYYTRFKYEPCGVDDYMTYKINKIEM